MTEGDLQNLAYALVQIAHNFGAVAVLGGAVAATLLLRSGVGVQSAALRRLGWLVLVGWLVQGASGAGFGAISYLAYGQFPDIHGIAVLALGIKMVCATAGFVAAAACLVWAHHWSAERCQRIWIGLAMLAAVALTCAAVLRWFS